MGHAAAEPSLMRRPRLRILTLALLLSSVGAAAVTGGATTAGAAGSVSVLARSGEPTRYDISGDVADAWGGYLDWIDVTATPVGGGPVEASAITYGGEFDLWVEPGTYVIELTDLDEVMAPTSYAQQVVVVDEAVDLGTITMLYEEPWALLSPRIIGEARPGVTLSATRGVWDTPDLSFSYTWLVDGVAAGTGPTYQVQAGDVGSKVVVRVKATALGYQPGFEKSGPKLVSAWPVDAVGRLLSGTIPAGRAARVKVLLRSDAPFDVTGLVKVTERGRTLAKARVVRTDDGRVVVSVPGLGAGKHSLVVKYGGSPVTAPDTSPVFTLTVTR